MACVKFTDNLPVLLMLELRLANSRGLSNHDVDTLNCREYPMTEFHYDTAFSQNVGIVSADEHARLRGATVAIAGMGGVGGDYLISLVRAGELLQTSEVFKTSEISAVRGWVSPTYAAKIPALSLAVEVQSTQSVQFTSQFTFPTEAD